VITEAFKKISTSSTLFISRGDNSGTHKKELSIWKKFEFTPSGKEWYIETGSGMGQTLNVASQKNGYCFTDRGTFLSLKKNLYLEILVQGDPDLINYYHVIEVNPEKFPKVNKNGGKMLAVFFVSKEVQEIIKSFGVDKYGEPLFYPDAETVAP
jgi:tungstate transport system substrate-binding protein